MKIKAEVILEVNGREVYRGPSKSFVANFAKVLLGILSAPGGTATGVGGVIASITIKATDGSSQTVWTEWYTGGVYYGGGTPMAMGAGDNDSSFGVVVGSGTTPVSPDNYNLSSQIPHGTGTGQLDYDTHVVRSSYSNTSSYIEILRSFTNRSGSNVIVNEVGLIARSFWEDSLVKQNIKYLIARDVLPGPILVPDSASLTVRYRISLSL
jgi:hypothetical protein